MLGHTPLQTFEMRGVPVMVKREDLCCSEPGPPFSKMRGVMAHIARRPEAVIGVLDTYHSKAGWAVAYACHELGKRTINYWPLYKRDEGADIRYPQLRSGSLGAQLVSLTAGRSAILYHAAKKDLATRSPGAYMMPNALKLSESVTENAAEAAATPLPSEGSMVISISSGTVASGVLMGMQQRGVLGGYDVYLHMGYTRPVGACLRYIRGAGALLMEEPRLLQFIDEGYGYAASVKVDVPFPCSPWYDAKAWKWLYGVVENLRKPIVFWNIGA